VTALQPRVNVVDERRAQGLAATITDVATLSRLAALVRKAERSGKHQQRPTPETTKASSRKLDALDGGGSTSAPTAA